MFYMLCFVLLRMETHGTPTPAPSVTVGRDTSHATRSPAQSVLRDRSLSSTPGSAAETVNHVRLGPCNQCKDGPQNGNDQIIFCLFVFFLWVPVIFFWGGGLKQSFFSSFLLFSILLFLCLYLFCNFYSAVWYSLLCVPSRQSWPLPGL